MPRASLFEPAHAARWLPVPTAVVRDQGGARGAERGHSAAVCRGHERGHERAERRGQIRRWPRTNSRRAAGRQRRLVGGPGGNPHIAGYLGSRPEGWQQRRGSQSQPRPVVQRLRRIQNQLCPLLTSGLSRFAQVRTHHRQQRHFFGPLDLQRGMFVDLQNTAGCINITNSG